MKAAQLVPFLLPGLSLAAPASLNTRQAQFPGSIEFRDITYGGGGCPQGSLDVSISGNGTVFGLTYDSFVASKGKGIAATEARKFCQVNFDILYSPGFQYQVYGADYHGYADLDAGVTGTVSSTYYYSGDVEQTTSSISIPGPFEGAYTKRDEESIITWSPCGSESLFNAKSTILLTGSGSGSLSVDKTNAKFTQWIYVKWQAC